MRRGASRIGSGARANGGGQRGSWRWRSASRAQPSNATRAARPRSSRWSGGGKSSHSCSATLRATRA
eukprot:scaffold90542_cov69-Phaeocystis_antarctica.AAC.5